MKDLKSSEMTVNIKSNLYVGPVNIFSWFIMTMHWYAEHFTAIWTSHITAPHYKPFVGGNHRWPGKRRANNQWQCGKRFHVMVYIDLLNVILIVVIIFTNPQCVWSNSTVYQLYNLESERSRHSSSSALVWEIFARPKSWSRIPSTIITGVHNCCKCPDSKP